MRKGNVKDERIVLQRRKVASDAFGILFYILLASVIVQQFIFHAPFSHYAVEAILLLAASIYVVTGNILVGNDFFPDDRGWKMVVMNSVFCGVVLAASVTALNTMNHGLEKMGGIPCIALIATITFACSALASFAVFGLLYLLNRKRQKQIDDRCNDADDREGTSGSGQR